MLRLIIFLPQTMEVYANSVNLVRLQYILLTKYIVHTSKEIKDSLFFSWVWAVCPRNTDWDWPKYHISMWKQFHEVFILTEQKKSYANIFLTICWQEHQAAGVDQSLGVHVMIPLAFGCVKATDGLSYCIE